MHKTSLKRGKSYIKSPEWVASKKAIINSKNDKCFKCSIIVALHPNKFKSHPERLSNTHLFISCIITGKI